MLSTDTTWEVVQSFLNVPGMKGVALIDGRSRPYFQGIERVLNSQQREALAQGVWQVLETIPDDFESFEFQFAGTQVYIHKLSQEQILLVLTHDNLIYPDYFDAFSRLRDAFNRDSSATMDVFQRLLGARNTKVTPLDLSDVANGDSPSLENAEAEKANEPQAGNSPQAAVEQPVAAEPEEVASSTMAQELPTLEIPSGSADYAVAADTEITDVSTAAVEPDAPANPVPPEPAVTDAADLLSGAESGGAAELPDLGATEAGLPDLEGGDASLPDLDATPAADGLGAAAQFAASLTDANALLGRSSSKADDSQPAELPSFNNEEPLLAVTPSPSIAPKSDAAADPQGDLAALMDTLSLGEEDFENHAGESAGEDVAATDAVKADAGDSDEQPAPTLPDLNLADDSDASPANSESLPEVEAADSENPWDELVPSASLVDDAIAEIPPPAPPAPPAPAPSPTAEPKEEPLLAVTQPWESEQNDGTEEQSDDLLNNRLDAVALDEDIEIDDLFGYEEPVADEAAPAEETAVLESYVGSLNALGEFSAHYLGRAVIVNYWRTSRPSDEWLRGAFAIERSANSIRLGPDYAASRQSPVTPGQQAALQTWAEQFVTRCSKVIRDFPQLAQQSLSEDQSSLLDL